jgi:hypothetical protein
LALVLDTGPLLAALDRHDRHHEACRRLLRTTREALTIPSPVLTELDYWLSVHAGIEAQLAFVDDVIAGRYEVVDLITDDYPRTRQIMAQYSDARVGFVDAAVLAIVERLNEPKLATLDHRHFCILRPSHVASLRLLPE